MTFFFFLPGIEVNGLPSAYVSWVRAAGALNDDTDVEYQVLPFVGII